MKTKCKRTGIITSAMAIISLLMISTFVPATAVNTNVDERDGIDLPLSDIIPNFSGDVALGEMDITFALDFDPGNWFASLSERGFTLEKFDVGVSIKAELPRIKDFAIERRITVPEFGLSFLPFSLEYKNTLLHFALYEHVIALRVPRLVSGELRNRAILPAA